MKKQLQPATKETATNEIGDILIELRQCIEEGIGEYLKHESQRAFLYHNRTKANLIRDNIIHQVKIKFEGRADITTSEKRGLFLLTINGKYRIKFKKFNKNLMSSNITTKNSQVFYLQMQMDFPGFNPFITNLEAGYMPDENYNFLETLRGFYLVCRKDKEILWKVNLSELKAAPAQEVVQFSNPLADTFKVIKGGKKVNEKKV